MGDQVSKAFQEVHGRHVRVEPRFKAFVDKSWWSNLLDADPNIGALPASFTEEA